MMNVVVSGVSFEHKPLEFCARWTAQFYFLSYFRTEYMIEVDGKLTRGHAGDFFIARPGDVIYHGSTEEVGFVNDWVYVDGDGLDTLLERYPLPTGKPFHVDSSHLLASALERINLERSYGEVGFQDKCELILTDAIIDIYRSYKRGDRVKPISKLEYARGEVMKDLGRPWTLSTMARLSGYSPSRFSALYQKHYGTSPINDLIARRLDEAKLLLLYGNMSLSEIAEATGFSSIYYFSKHFKKKEGISPSEYKKCFGIIY